MAKRLTTNQRLYKKELTRIKRAISRLEKQEGLTVNLGDIVNLNRKKITKKAIEELKEITTKKLRKVSAPLIQMYDVIMEDINKLPTVRYFRVGGVGMYVDFTDQISKLISYLDDNYIDYGSDYDKYLNFKYSEIQYGFNAIIYDSELENVERSFVEVAYILKGVGLTQAESEYFTDLEENL